MLECVMAVFLLCGIREQAAFGARLRRFDSTLGFMGEGPRRGAQDTLDLTFRSEASWLEELSRRSAASGEPPREKAHPALALDPHPPAAPPTD